MFDLELQNRTNVLFFVEFISCVWYTPYIKEIGGFENGLQKAYY